MLNIFTSLPAPNAVELKAEKIKVTFKCFLFTLLIKYVFALIMLLSDTVGFKALGEIYKHQVSLSQSYDKLIVYFFIIILGPLLEEFAFRGWFTKNRLLAFFSLTVLSFYFWKFIGIHVWLGNKYVVYPTLVVASATAIFFYLTEILDSIEKKLRLAIFLSICCFTAIHIFNFKLEAHELTVSSLIAMIIILVPYFLMGTVLTYLRFKCGLIWSMGLHIINNSFVLVALFL